ncbi:MAG TPA: hypothetical protein VME92_15655 [Acetobacteraceae bacterium]|nr:hypothetical protein [Acetobacteraceae bacterium]
MVQLVLVLCLAGTHSCVERRPTYEEPISLMMCMIGGQRAAAAYLDSHPAYRLQSWRCEVGVPQQAKL